MSAFEKPTWEIVRFCDDVIRTSKTLPIDWFIQTPDPAPGTGGSV